MGMTKIPYPFVRHPLTCPGFATGKRIVSVTQGGDAERGAIHKFVAGPAVKERIELKAFVKSIGNEYVDKRR
jgi:hypothetical protein